MAALNDLQRAAVGSEAVGTIDVLVGIAGPVSDDNLRRRATESIRGLVSGGLRVAVASPVASQAEVVASAGFDEGLQFLSYPLSPAATPSLPWLASPAAYREIARLGEECGARACVILSQDLGALDGAAIEALAQPILAGEALLSAPLYPTGKYEGLLNSAIVYPFTRALYGRRIRHPLATDFGIGGAMIPRLATDVSRGKGSAVHCSVVDATVADFGIAEANLNVRHVAHTDGIDLTTVLGTLAGCLFEDAEKNAAYWQRVRGSHAAPVFGSPAAPIAETEGVDVRPLIESFNLGSRNLQEIWGLVLPPVTLLELKRLSRLPAEQFRMPDSVWARVVYDFALAHRLRSISRAHLLGALTPLYLGWVASYAAEVQAVDAEAAELRIEQLATAYEEAKPYFVSRWRWPDRFNP